MSERSVIVSVLLAVVLLGAWLLTTFRASPDAPTPAPLLPIDPALVQRIELHRPTGPRVWIERSEHLGTARWFVHTLINDEPMVWPAEDARVRAGLRVLASSRIEPATPELSSEARLTLTLVDGSTHSIEFDASPLAGRVLVRSVPDEGTPVQGFVEAALFDAFVQTSLTTWRDPRPFAVVGPGPARIELESAAGSLALARREARWTMLEPIQIAADNDAANELTSQLAGINAVTMHDTLTAADARTSLSQPLATLATETDLRLPDASGETVAATIRQSVRVGGPADLTGTRVYAEVLWTVAMADARAETLAGPVVVELNTADLNTLNTRAETYFSRRATTFAANMIERITLTDRARTLSLERDGLSWISGNAALLPGDAEAINNLLGLLTTTQADDVRLAPRELPPDQGTTIALHFGIGPPAAQFRLFPLVDIGGIMAIDQTIIRGYAGNKPMLETVESLLERMGVSISP